MIATLFISFFALMFLGVPIAASLGVGAMLTIIYFMNSSLVVTAQTMFNGVNSFPLMAIPFFILAGNLMGEGGISRRLVDFVQIFFGSLKGGLAMVAIVASMFFAAISGSCPATTAAIGGIMLFEMEKNGYSKDFSAACVSAAGTVGQVIPPSIPMVTYCVLANTSISTLFLCGVGPGILMGISMMIVARIYAKNNNVPLVKVDRSLGNVAKVFVKSIWALIMPVIILGGIYSGIFTATEAGAVACVYALIVGVFVYRDLKIKDIPMVVAKSAVGASVIMLIMATVSTFGYVLTMGQIPQKIASAMLSLTSNKYVLLLLLNIIVLIAGCFLNSSAAIALLTPILLPVMTAPGVEVSPYLVGIIFIVNMGIGMITPPVGNCLYVGCNIAGIKFETIVKAIVPFLIAEVIVLFLTTYIPTISLGLAGVPYTF
ncbi:MAG: TRAP transporter large permease [Synergistaceae bacterium]|nr:TRAP transporter large permease [Synergistaceae bacterium]MBQ6737301.1 TRAP transporter large permease [Synergistaceae bacterium]MBQ7067839.1 TRAP transporter large permease [Synergistaceae bacterium]MBR0076451.1 TRAP transporter large permease [Synergistaceae bacterium]MBR0078902.1 TRAP transporter large permease [Synergistaceae bacterium]